MKTVICTFIGPDDSEIKAMTIAVLRDDYAGKKGDTRWCVWMPGTLWFTLSCNFTDRGDATPSTCQAWCWSDKDWDCMVRTLRDPEAMDAARFAMLDGAV